MFSGVETFRTGLKTSPFLEGTKDDGLVVSIAPPFPPSGMPAEHPGSPWLRGGLAHRVLGSLRRLVARLDALSPHHPLSAFLGAPADQAGQGATASDPPGDARHRIGRWMEWAHQSQRFSFSDWPRRRASGLVGGPVRTIYSGSPRGPATVKDRDESRRITAAFTRPAGTSEQTRSPGVRRKPSRLPTFAVLRWESFPFCSRAWP